MLEEYERMYRSMTSDGNLEKKMQSAQATIEMALKKKRKLLELAAMDSITNADFKSMTAQCNEEIKASEAELAELREQQESSGEFRAHMEKIRATLKAAEKKRRGRVHYQGVHRHLYRQNLRHPGAGRLHAAGHPDFHRRQH